MLERANFKEPLGFHTWHFISHIPCSHSLPSKGSCLCICISHGSLTFPDWPLAKGGGRHIQEQAMLKVSAFPGLDLENCNFEIFQILQLPIWTFKGNFKEIRFGTNSNNRPGGLIDRLPHPLSHQHSQMSWDLVARGAAKQLLWGWAGLLIILCLVIEMRIYDSLFSRDIIYILGRSGRVDPK